MPNPKPIIALSGRKIIKVVASDYQTWRSHALALTEDRRTIYSWGDNTCGQLGRGSVGGSDTIGAVEALDGESIGTHSSLTDPSELLTEHCPFQLTLPVELATARP